MEFQVQSAKYPYSSDTGNRKKFLLKYSQELEPFHYENIFLVGLAVDIPIAIGSNIFKDD